MAVEAAVRVDMPLLADSGSDAAANLGSAYTGVAVHEEGQWASLCPELDIASVGADADEAMNNLVQAVAEALAFAGEEGLQPGRPTPPDDLRAFMVSGDAPFYVRKFYWSTSTSASGDPARAGSSWGLDGLAGIPALEFLVDQAPLPPGFSPA